MKKTDVYIWCLGALLCANTFQSCSEEEILSKEETNQFATTKKELSKKLNYFTKPDAENYIIHEIFFDEPIPNAPCEVTDFGATLNKYFQNLENDPFYDHELINYYAELNRKYVTYYMGDNYYGKDGAYNNLADKRIRELQKFWDLNREIYLNGQHTAFLNDREILADMIESFDRTVRNREEAYDKADALININTLSNEIPENPYFALDAFTKSNGLLVIGDGLLETLVAVGIEEDIAFTGILSHEWWHQAQFENDVFWDYTDTLSTAAEISRFTELEADFAAAYFMSHKRGATFNWKRIEEYFRLSYNVGDCLYESNSHHGTPYQRLQVAKLGYELADSSQKKGYILSPDEVHRAFLSIYFSVVP